MWDLASGDAEKPSADPRVGLLRDPQLNPHQLRHGVRSPRRAPPDFGRRRGRPESAERLLHLTGRRRRQRALQEGRGGCGCGCGGGGTGGGGSGLGDVGEGLGAGGAGGGGEDLVGGGAEVGGGE